MQNLSTRDSCLENTNGSLPPIVVFVVDCKDPFLGASSDILVECECHEPNLRHAIQPTYHN